MYFLVIVAVISSSLANFSRSNDLEGSYIVKLKGELRTTMDTHIKMVESLFTDRASNNKIQTIYTGLGPMYSAFFSAKVVRQVMELSEVEYVEADSEVRLLTNQANAPWGLARISQRSKLGDTKNYKYLADGAGVSVYVVDSGIFVKHPEFEGRARFGARFIGENDLDENGHGTHCAGTIGSKTYGVAKKVSLVAVRVLDAKGTGSVSGAISGIDWVVKDKKGKKGNVINMSLGVNFSKALNDAVQAAVNKNIVVVVAAGNENEDACKKSPSSEPSAITVAAMNNNDTRASFSNWGKCVDVFGPGVDILSTWNDSKTNIISGTSMATPHVAGLAAYFLSQKSESVAAITAKITSKATKKTIIDAGNGTPNLLVYNGIV